MQNDLFVNSFFYIFFSTHQKFEYSRPLARVIKWESGVGFLASSGFNFDWKILCFV